MIKKKNNIKMQLNYQDVLEKVITISKEVGAQIKEHSQNFKYSDIEKKGLNDYVSYVDKSAEKFIVERLKPIIPEAGFIVEENTVEYHGEKYKWIVDPLDGTTNFIHGFYPYAVSIGLMKDDEIILGVIYEIGLGECFYASKNSGAFLNGSKIQVSEKNNLNEALIATGFPYSDFDKLDKYLKLLEYFTKNTQGVRRLGSAAVDLAYVACGRFDAFYEYALNPWDVAAGIIIVKEAGGNICDFKGENNYLFGREIVASNNIIYDNLKNVIVKYLSM